MRGDLPVPGSARAKLLDVGLELFSTQPYDAVDVKVIASRAGVTIGALYHHFGSKQGIYGVLRDDMTKRVLDRVEAALDAASEGIPLRIAVLAAYDGIFRIRAGYLLTESDPREQPDALALAFAEKVQTTDPKEAEISGQLLAAALRAALHVGSGSSDGQQQARNALIQLLP